MQASDEDLKLIRRVADGDGDAAEDFDRRFRPYLIRFTSRRVRPEDVGDIVQEALFAAFKEIQNHRFEGRSEPATWLVQILRNKICDHERKHDRERKALGRPQEIFPIGFASSDVIDERQHRPDLAVEVAQLLSRLQKEERVLLTLHLREGWTTEEIAQRMKMNPSTVGGILWRAKRALQNQGSALKKLTTGND